VGSYVGVLVRPSTADPEDAVLSQVVEILPGLPPTNTAPPTVQVSGLEATVDVPQTSTVGSWNRSPTSYSYQWSTCLKGSCTSVSGAVGASYTPRPVDYGKTLKVAVTACNIYGCSPAASSAASNMVDVARAATWSLQVPETANQALYYVGSNGQIWTKFFNGSAWSKGQLGTGEPAAVGTKPVVVRNAITGAQSVYYIGKESKKVWTWFFDGTGKPWFNSVVSAASQPAAPGTSVAAIRVPNSGDQAIYYVGSDSQIWILYLPYGMTQWANSKPVVGSGKPAAPNTSPALTRDPLTGRQQVFYVGDDNAIWSWFYDGAKWENSRMGGLATGTLAAAGASPTALFVPSNQNTIVYYVGIDGLMWNWYYDGTAAPWANGKLINPPSPPPQPAEPGVTPFVVRSFKDERQSLYYMGTDKRVWTYFFDGFKWSDNRLSATDSGEAAATGSPLTVVQDPTNENQGLYYMGVDGNIWSWGFGGTAWYNGPIAP
jgi:hypothetical protein